MGFLIVIRYHIFHPEISAMWIFFSLSSSPSVSDRPIKQATRYKARQSNAITMAKTLGGKAKAEV